MISLDHTILRVRNQAESIRFYQQVLGLKHEGSAGPFEILRVHEGLTIDLIQQIPQDRIHLAFCLERASFKAVHSRLLQLNVPFGNGPHERNRGTPVKWIGARGLADALYFDDPDEHIIEIRTYETA